VARLPLIAIAACALTLSACGGSDDVPVPEGSVECADLPAAPTTAIRFDVRAEEPSEDLTAETAEVVCARLQALGVTARVEPADSQVVVTINALDPDAGLAERVSTPAVLSIYDWEGSLLEKKGFANRRDAEKFAAKRGEKAIVVEDREEGRFYVLRDDPALTGADLVGAKQGFDPEVQEPSIGLAFTDEGGPKFEDLTRRVAHRGGSFAVVVDGVVLSKPVIDATTDPDGIDADNGVLISGGMTVDEARSLAAFLEAEPLPEGVELVPAESR